MRGIWGRRPWALVRAATVATMLVGLAAGCTSSGAPTSGASGSSAGLSGIPADATTLTLQAPTSYTPTTPPGGGTDDYHCTLVDPHVTKDSDIVASEFLPQSPEVHHAILF